MRTLLTALVVLMAAMFLIGCTSSVVKKKNDDQDTESSDLDSDSDGDSDSDSDSDTDGDTDTDSDTDSDTDTDTDTDTGTDTGPLWDVPICQTGGYMNDCGIISCGSPPPSLTETMVIPVTGDGKLVTLSIDTNPRTIFSFSDISATLSNGTTTVKFYNNYNAATGTTSHNFPTEWPIPHFWGEEIGGTWTLEFEDSEYTAGNGFDLLEWCLTFEDPTTTAAYLTSGTWSGTQTGHIDDYSSTSDPPSSTTTVFETKINDLINANGGTPTLSMTISHSSPSDLSIWLVAADGTTFYIKSQGTTTIPSTFPLNGLSSDWLTGMYKLSFTDHVANNSGTLSGWSIGI